MTESVSDRSLRGLAAPTLGALALVLVLVSGTFAALLLSVRDSHQEAASARHAEEILKHVSAAERHVVDVETGLRGFLLTGDTDFLEPYHSGRLAYRADLAGLDRLVQDPVQRRRLGELRRAIDGYVEGYAVPLRVRAVGLSRAEAADATAEG